MPSYAPDSSYASTSSSRHAEYGSSRSRSDRHPDDMRRRPRSPDDRHRDYRLDRDRHRPSYDRREDDERSFHRSSHSSRYPDERNHLRDSGRGWSPPPRDHRRALYDAHESAEYNHYGSSRQRSPPASRGIYPEAGRSREDDARDQRRLDGDRSASRRSTDDRDSRRSSISDRTYHGSDRRGDRSPDRSRSSLRETDPYQPRRSGDYDTAQYRTDHRDSRRNGRSRSRSRDRSRAIRSRDDYPASEEGRHSQSRHDERLARINGVGDDSRLLKRKDQTDRSQRPQPDVEKEEGAIPESTSGWDAEDDRLERLASTSKTGPGVDDRKRTSSDVNGTTKPSRSSQPNGHATEPSRIDHTHGYSRERRRSRSPPSSASASRPHKPTSGEPASPPASRATKETIRKLSYGHVLLPHELPAELRGKNTLAVTSDSAGAGTVLRSAAEKQVVDAKTKDPRKPGNKRDRCRDMLHRARFVWDANSVGEKPLPPPRNLVLTNLSPLMSTGQVLQQARPFGRIESSKLEMDPRIGQSLGVFSITFAHDFDEHGKRLASAAADSTPQNGAKAAKAAQHALNGRQLGPTRVVAVLDRNGEVLAEKVKQQLAINDAKLRRPAPVPPAARVDGSPATSSAAKPTMPPPDLPRGPRASAAAALSPSVSSPSISGRAVSDRQDGASSRHSRHAVSSEEGWRSGATDPYHRQRDRREHDTDRDRSYSSRRADASHRSPSPARAEAPKKQYQKLKTDDILDTLRNSERPYIFIPKPKLCDIETGDVEECLKSTPPLWIREGDAGWYAAFARSSEANACKMVNETLTIGGFTLQVDVRPPPPKFARIVPPKKTPSIRDPAPSAGGGREARPATPAAQPRKPLDTGLRPLTAEEKQKTDWTAAELQDAVFRMLQKELADTFIRDVKSRLVAPHLASYLKPDSEGGQILAKAVIKKPQMPSKTVDRAPTARETDGEARLPSFRRVAAAKPKKTASDADATATKAKKDALKVKKDREPALKFKSQRSKAVSSSDDESDDTERQLSSTGRRDSRTKSRSATKKRGPAAWLMESSDDEAESDDAATTELDATSRSVSASVEPSNAEQTEEDARGKKKTKAKVESASRKKGTAAAKKGTKPSATPSEVDGDADEDAATPETEVSAKAAKGKAKTPKAPAKTKAVSTDPFEAGIVQDAEDCYYLRLALEHLRTTGELPDEAMWPDEVELEAEAEERALAAGALPRHSTGAARTEGFYRIPPEQKAMHLPDRNKATEDADAASTAHILQSARNNRADSRRLVLGIEQHKRETATDTDIFKFNQLRTRKKQLKFAKSPIHDWGLYAMEYIPAGDMVIEYVGEVVRQQVADEREKQYERQGNFSTYLFRVDDDLVVDATHKGNIARLMNHCCTPNCNAKILTLNGEKRIVLFAKTPIRAGEELTYDYKFQSSADDEDAIPCLCGSPGCRRFL